jgi:hypothetical protein
MFAAFINLYNFCPGSADGEFFLKNYFMKKFKKVKFYSHFSKKLTHKILLIFNFYFLPSAHPGQKKSYGHSDARQNESYIEVEPQHTGCNYYVLSLSAFSASPLFGCVVVVEVDAYERIRRCLFNMQLQPFFFFVAAKDIPSAKNCATYAEVNLECIKLMPSLHTCAGDDGCVLQSQF